MLLFLGLAAADPLPLDVHRDVTLAELAKGTFAVEVPLQVVGVVRGSTPCGSLTGDQWTLEDKGPDTCRAVFALTGGVEEYALVWKDGRLGKLSLALRTVAAVPAPWCAAGRPTVAVPGPIDVGAVDRDRVCGSSSDLEARLDGLVVSTAEESWVEARRVTVPSQPWFVYDPTTKRWSTTTVSGAGWRPTTPGGAQAASGSATTPLLLRVEGGGPAQAWSFRALDKARPAQAAPPAGACAPPTSAETLTYVWCVAMGADGALTDQLYSRWDAHGRLRSAWLPTSSPYLVPNLPLRVLVFLPDGFRAELSGTGVIQVQEAVPDNGIRATTAGVGTPASQGFVLAPRGAGGFTSALTIKKRGATDTFASVGREFVVLHRYFGALRTGFSGYWSPFEREYEVGGSNQLLLAKDQGEVGGVEIALGFSTYPKALLRVPDEEGHLGVHPGAAIYVGVGIVGLSESLSTSVFRTLYLGADWELTRQASLTLAATIRRGSAPMRPYEEGSVLATSTENWDTQRPYPGVAVLVNLTPWYFRQLSGGLGTAGTTD